HAHAALVHAAGGHALVAAVDHHAHAVRRQRALDAAGDLCGHLLLHLEATGIGLDHARELADPHHLAVGQVAHVHAADDRRHVVLAVAFELDVAQHDHLVVAGDLLEGARHVLVRIQAVAAEPLRVGVDHAPRRVEQAFARRILAGPLQQGAHRVFGLRARNAVARVVVVVHGRAPRGWTIGPHMVARGRRPPDPWRQQPDARASARGTPWRVGAASWCWSRLEQRPGSRWVSAGGSGPGREPASGIEGPDPAIAAKSAPTRAAPTMVYQRRPAMRSRSGRTCGQPPARAWYSATALATLRVRPSAKASCACSWTRSASSTSSRPEAPASKRARASCAARAASVAARSR